MPIEFKGCEKQYEVQMGLAVVTMKVQLLVATNTCQLVMKPVMYTEEKHMADTPTIYV